MQIGYMRVSTDDLLWGVVMDGYHPDRYDIIGALICFAGVAVIMYAPRNLSPSTQRCQLPGTTLKREILYGYYSDPSWQQVDFNQT